MRFFLNIFLIILINIITSSIPVYAARDTNSYDGNIFPIYAGNGSLVPPQSSLSKSLKLGRTSALIFYLDDSADSKEFAPVVSGIKLLWGSTIDVIPITIDSIQGKASKDPSLEEYYWHGNIPQTVIINGKGEVLLDSEGQTDLKEINNAISKATGIEPPEFTVSIKSFNEYNSEPSKDGYTDPR